MWMAAIQAIGSANQKKASLKIQKAQLGVEAKMAELDGASYALKLTSDFNRAMASDAVIGAAQGRRGGSVAAVASAAENQYNWDMDFAEASTEIRQMGLDANMSALGRAADTAQTTGYVSAAAGAFNSYQESRERKSLLATKEEK